MGSGQLQLSASRLLMPARHRPGALSSSDGRQPLWMLLPPHGTRQPYSAGQTALPSGTRRCPAASKAAGTATSLSRERPLHPWQVAATYTAVGRRSCRGAPQHEAGGRGRRRYIAAPHMCSACRIGCADRKRAALCSRLSFGVAAGCHQGDLQSGLATAGSGRLPPRLVDSPAHLGA